MGTCGKDVGRGKKEEGRAGRKYMKGYWGGGEEGDGEGWDKESGGGKEKVRKN